MMEEAPEKQLENYNYATNELVLCYEPDPKKAKMLYDAKILDIGVTKDELGNKVPEYYVHFQGWNKSWDRWVLEGQILKTGTTERGLQSKLYKTAIKPGAKHKKKVERDEEQENRGSVGNLTDDDDVIQLPVVTLNIPKVLATLLEDDCYNIKRRKVLISLPRQPSATEILNNYYTYCQTAFLPGKSINLQVVHEMIEGLHTYFNFTLASLLLYNFERAQYAAIFPAVAMVSTTASHAPLPTATSPNAGYSPQWRTAVPTEPRSLRSRTAGITSPPPPPPSAEKVSPKLEVEPLPNADVPEEEAPPADFVRRRSSRHQAGGESSAEGTELEELPLSPPRKRPARPVTPPPVTPAPTPVAPPPATPVPPPVTPAATPVVAMPRCSIIPATDCSQNAIVEAQPSASEEADFAYTQSGVHNFMELPLNERKQTPADIYGPEHLLRLFVKLPSLLASANMEEQKLSLLLENVSVFLGYLSERTDLFTETVYSESVL